MNLHEYQGKEILSSFGVDVQRVVRLGVEHLEAGALHRLRSQEEAAP